MFRSIVDWKCADGTLFHPPMDPEYKMLLKEKFPSCKTGGSYECCYCGKCPRGDYFVWPEDLASILKRQHDLEKNFLLEHGCSSVLDLIAVVDPPYEKQAS